MTQTNLRTDVSGEPMYRTGDAAVPHFALTHGQVRGLPVSVDYVKLNSEGKLQIALVGEAIRGEELEKVRELLTVMQGRVLVDFTPCQGELPL